MAHDQPTPHFSKLAEELIGDLRGIETVEPHRQRKRPTKGLTVLVEELLQKYQVGRDSPEQVIRDHWVEIVGTANASYAHAAQIDPKGRLIVLASHSVVRNELFHHRQTIVERIRKLPGCDHVKSLNLRAG